MNVLESILRKNIYQKSSGVSEEKTLKKAFKQFDTDGWVRLAFVSSSPRNGAIRPQRDQARRSRRWWCATLK